MGVNHPNLDNLPFRRKKTVVQRTSAGQFTGSRTIGELLLLKKGKGHKQKNVRSAASDTPKKIIIEVMSLLTRKISV